MVSSSNNNMQKLSKRKSQHGVDFESKRSDNKYRNQRKLKQSDRYGG